MGIQENHRWFPGIRNILRPINGTILAVLIFGVMPAYTQGIITTAAGNGRYGYSGDGGPAAQASLSLGAYTGGVAVDAAGNLYIADTGNNRIRMVDLGGTIKTVAGSGRRGFSGDGGPATNATLSSPAGLAVDRNGNIFVVDTGNQRIRKVSQDGTINTVAGNGAVGFTGDGGPATSASLGLNQFTDNCAVDGEGNLYIPDTENELIRRVGTDGIIRSVAHAHWPYSVAVDPAASFYIGGEYGIVVRIDAAGRSLTVVGGGPVTNELPDVLPALSAWLAVPAGVAVDNMGNIYIADSHVQRVRKVTPDGMMTTVAGSGEVLTDIFDESVEGGFSGDGGPATAARLNFPWGVAVDTAGNIYVADSLNNRIRKISASSVRPDIWVPTSSHLTDVDVTVLVVDPLHPMTIYAGTGSQGVFKSTNAGADWSQTSLEGVKVNILAVDSSHAGTLYAGTDGRGLLKSTDGGTSWGTAGPDIPNVNLLTADPRGSGTLLAGYSDPGAGFSTLFKSTDDGGSWTQISLPQWTLSVAIDPVNPDTIYSIEYGFLGMEDVGWMWKSTDGGKNWVGHYLHDNGFLQLVVDPIDSNMLYASGFNPSFKSTDGGITWKPFALPIERIAADPKSAGTLYAIANGSVYRSPNRGDSWNSLAQGFTGTAKSLAVSGSNPGMVFAGTQAGGVFKDAAVLTLDRMEYCVGGSWNLSIVNAPASTAIKLVGASNGVPWEWADWGMTDGDGRYSATGAFNDGSQGNHQLYVAIGGSKSNTIFASISDCKK